MENRAKLRGRRLNYSCYKAKTTKNEYGIKDKRIFCHGLVDKSTEVTEEKCINCKAFVNNAESLKEPTDEM